MGRAKLALATLALSAFVVGTCELVIVGLLDVIAKSTDVTISTAGQLVTAYALGISIGGPLIAALTIRMGRRAVLLLSLAAFVCGNVVTVVAVDYGLLFAARVATGAVQGLFIGVASVVAADLVAPDRRGQAMSMVFGGIAVSTVLGVPLGTLLGRGLGWRAAFVAIVALGLVVLIGALVFVPAVKGQAPVRFAEQARAALAPPVLTMLGVGLLLIGGQFTVFTYLTPYLQRVTGISGGAVSAFLLVYGVASAAGTFVGGRLADRSASRTLVAANALLILALGAVYLVGAIPGAVAVALAAWGLVGFGLVPSLQLRVISLAGPGGDLAATMGASAVNLGIALGAFAGGRVVAGAGLHPVVLAGIAVVAVALPLTWASGRLRPVPERAEPPAPAVAAACHAVCVVEAGRSAARVLGEPVGKV